MFKRFQMTQDCGVTLQRGSALIVALVFLLVMTLIGTTAMQGTTQQERMAGNYLDRMMSFQSTEGALSVARGVTPPTSPNGLVNSAGQQPDSWWKTPPPPQCPTGAALATAQPCWVSGYENLSSPPLYVIEKLSGMGRSESGGVGIVGRTSEGTFMCRYTARSTGGSSDALTILEETRDCT